MPPRKDRCRVVLDTNVVVSYILRRRLRSAASRIFALWYKQHHLQLIVSDEVVAEYYEVLERLNVDERRVEHLYDLLQRAGIVTYANLGARYVISRILGIV